jgi:hypothetical protein
MKTTPLVMLVLIAATLAAPGWAQRAGQAHSGVTLPGKVTQVDARARQVRLALYLLAPRADAPGKMPDEMAAQVAQLKDAAEKLEQAGKPVQAREIREHIDKLLRWRQVDQTVSVNDARLIGIRRTNLAQLEKGTHMRMVVSTNAANATDLPARVTLERDVMQVGTRAEAGWHRYAGTKGGSQPGTRAKTFFEVVGEVTAASPLTVQVGEKTIQVDAAPQHSFIQQTSININQVTPGQRFIARVRLAGPLEVQGVTRLIILIDNVDIPPLEDDDLEV